MTDAADARPESARTIRAFVAVELPLVAVAWCEAAITRARGLLGPNDSAMRWVRPEGSHLTLQFLGSVPLSQVPSLIDRLNAELAGHPPFELSVGRLGVFPGPRAPRVLWLALLGDLRALGGAQEYVESATISLGFARENRPFQPHLTLGRVREGATPEQLAAIGRLSATWPVGASSLFQVGAVSLIQSELGTGGARYSRVAEIQFG